MPSHYLGTCKKKLDRAGTRADHLWRVRESDSGPQVGVLRDDGEVDLVGVLVEVPSGEVVASLGGHAAVARVLPLAAAEVQDAAGVVADALLHLDQSWEEMTIKLPATWSTIAKGGLFVVLACCHLPKLDGFNQHFQAPVLCSLISDVD